MGSTSQLISLNAGHEWTGQWQYEWRQRQFVPTSSDPVSVNIYPYQHLHRIYPYTNGNWGKKAVELGGWYFYPGLETRVSPGGTEDGASLKIARSGVNLSTVNPHTAQVTQARHSVLHEGGAGLAGRMEAYACWHGNTRQTFTDHLAMDRCFSCTVLRCSQW